MYLLIPDFSKSEIEDIKNLHPTMYLLIHRPLRRLHKPLLYLHPTMYLLILDFIPNTASAYAFTSHYVSINSRAEASREVSKGNLHPTMYLLIPKSLSDIEQRS